MGLAYVKNLIILTSTVIDSSHPCDGRTGDNV